MMCERMRQQDKTNSTLGKPMTGEAQWQRAGATKGAEGEATGCEAQRQAALSSICDAAAVVPEPMGKDMNQNVRDSGRGT